MHLPLRIPYFLPAPIIIEYTFQQQMLKIHLYKSRVKTLKSLPAVGALIILFQMAGNTYVAVRPFTGAAGQVIPNQLKTDGAVVFLEDVRL